MTRALKALIKRMLNQERLEFSIKSRTTSTGRPRKKKKKRRKSRGRKIEKFYWVTTKPPTALLLSKTSNTKQ